MNQGRSYLQRYAMLFGTYMGVFWIFKFILLPVGTTVPFFATSYLILTMLVPFMGFFYTRMYRDKVCGGGIGFVHAWLFTMFLYMFASLLTTVAHYIYFQFIDNGYLLHYALNMMDAEKLAAPKELQANYDLLREALNEFLTQTPINITVNIMSSNVMWGAILAVPTALFAMKKRKPAETPEQPATNQ